MKKPSKIIYVLSIIPGLGQFAMGLMNRGLQFMLLFFALVFLASTDALLGMFAFCIPIVVVYAYFDALKQYRCIKEMKEADDSTFIPFHIFKQNKNIIGWFLIGLGAISLLSRITDLLPLEIRQYVSDDFLNSIIISCLFIYFGYRIIAGKKVFPFKMGENFSKSSQDNTQQSTQILMLDNTSDQNDEEFLHNKKSNKENDHA